MSAWWLFVVAVLTQYPQPPVPELLKRPEVKAFIGPPLCQYEQYAKTPTGFLVGVQPHYDGLGHYYVLDDRGRIDAKATERLTACLTPPPRAHAPQVLPLASERGVVVDGQCLVTGDSVHRVADIWGEAWQQLVAPSELPPPAVVATFRASEDYRAFVPEQTASVDTVPLPGSPYQLALVTLPLPDPMKPQQPTQKIFVVAANGGTTNLALTAALERELRDELNPVCGGQPFGLSAAEDVVTLSVQDGRDWGDGCQALVEWDTQTRRVRVLARDIAVLLDERRRAEAKRKRNLAVYHLEHGEHAAAFELWRQLSGSLTNDPEGAELCRAFADDSVKAGRIVEARQQLEGCTGLTFNRGEAQLRLATFLSAQGERLAALVHYELALAAPLSDTDRAETRRTANALELQLAIEAESQQRLDLAKLRYQRLLHAALGPDEAQQVRAALRRLP